MKCPHCNVPMVWDGVVRTSYPPKYGHKCPKCGFFDFYDHPEEEHEMQEVDVEGISKEQMELLKDMPIEPGPAAIKYSEAVKEAVKESFRNQAAIAAMQGVMNFFGSLDYNRETIARLAVEQADALIEELKKK